MKNNFYLLLILILTSFTTNNTSITILGKITNTEDGIIRIKGESFEKEIKLNEDGSFSENLSIEYDGLYAIETYKSWMPIYFSKDSKIIIHADDNNFLESVQYTGDGSVENQYITKKLMITSEIPVNELYQLDENEFLIKIKEIDSSVKVLYNNTTFTNPYFKKKEVDNIRYLNQLNLCYYKKSHEFFSGVTNFEVSEKFPKYDETIDLDNDADFLFSNEYKEFVLRTFYDNINIVDAIPYRTASNSISEIKALKSQNLKNRLIQNAISEIGLENENYENTYIEFLSIVTDPKIKDSLTAKYNSTKLLSPGMPSPKFDYINQKGGKTSLESLEGKYVYIDVWATWCGPCIKEIPSLQKVEQQYKGKNIAFVSISIDDIKNQEKWSQFVDKKKLGGIQLLADNDWKSKFIKEFSIKGVPTFILIDPNGNIVNARAPRPSETKLIDLLNSLKI